MAITLNNRALITIYGGSGFIGRHVVRAIAKTGARMRIAVRRPELAGFLQPLGGVGQINAVQANVRYADSLLAAAEAPMPSSISWASCFRPASRPSNRCRTRARGMSPRRRERPAPARFVHVSAIGASADAPSGLCAQQGGRRARGEVASMPDAVILRPSIVFGPEDDFFNRFAAARAHLAGTASDRRRQDAIPAGVRRRRGQGGRSPALTGETVRRTRLTSSAGPRCSP